MDEAITHDDQGEAAPLIWRAPLWYKIVHLVKVALARTRPATADEVVMIRRHQEDLVNLKAEIERLAITVKARDAELAQVREELAKAKSQIRIHEVEITLLADVNQRNAERVRMEKQKACAEGTAAEFKAKRDAIQG